MHEISYAGGTFVTSDEVAKILVDYAAALANAERAASVDVPVAGLPGGESTLQVLVGPASQLMSVPVESEHEVTAGADEFVDEVRSRIERLEARWTSQSGEGSYDWEL